MVRIPALPREFLARAIPRLQSEEWLLGVAATGSYASDSMDEFSDLDLTLVIDDASFETILSEGKQIAAELGQLLTAFSGEHVGEPRLLLCMYGNPVLHVDFFFTKLSELRRVMQEPVVLWERSGLLSERLRNQNNTSPLTIDPQWMADRIRYLDPQGSGKHRARGTL